MSFEKFILESRMCPMLHFYTQTKTLPTKTHQRSQQRDRPKCLASQIYKLVAPGLTTRNKMLLVAKGISTRNKDATRNKGHRY